MVDMRTLIMKIRDIMGSGAVSVELDEVFIREGAEVFRLDESNNWISGRFQNNLRIDDPSHGVGKKHAHVLGRKGNQIGVVNVDGSASHGSKFRLNDKDADALRSRGFTIPDDGIVECVFSAKVNLNESFWC